ncbi:penicillin acylase family protein [Flavobacteriaceae bacterium F08102]|nr:penicillin acylase family protein [Flavobacteriaceae bacterium F08102]
MKKILKVISFVIIAILIIGFFTFHSLKPQYNGEISLNNLNEKVTVYYDSIGVPHIYAQNELDAQRALGYVHAQDRLWQMELMRRLAAGRLSELFGDVTLETDKLFSSLGIEEAAEETIANLDPNTEAYQLTMAYLDGINQFIQEGPTPIEFYLLGIDKSPYSLKDVYNVYGYMAFSFASAYKVDPVVTEVSKKLGSAYVDELNIPLSEKSALLRTEKGAVISSAMAETAHQIFETLPISPFIGSNSWVIGPEKTKNGKVLFANDPHIGFSQPAVWYAAHIHTPSYEMYGYHLALTPFPLLGHNREKAFGLTMFANDDIDFYVEENHPKDSMQYKTPDGYERYALREKHIAVKDKDTVSYTIKVSRHGPLLNGVIRQIIDERPIAMDWIYTKKSNQLMQASYGMGHAKNINEFKKNVSTIHAPGLNVMYGDAKNNIAWFAVGQLYELADSVSTKVFLDGASGKHEKQRYLPFEENPQAINPAKHYVYSANNQPDSINGKFYPGYYRAEDRAKRIAMLLDAKNDFTKEDVMKMINDVTNPVVPQIIDNFTAALPTDALTSEEKKALMLLQDWDGSYTKEAVAPTLYARLIYEFLTQTYHDEMGSTFDVFINTSLQQKVLAVQMARDSSVWWDNITTKDYKESKADIVTASFKNAITFLKKQLGANMQTWQWKRVHTLEHQHPIGQKALLRPYFNVGPFEINGGPQVINNMNYKMDSTGYYKVTAGPSNRRVVDFSNIEESMGVIPTGQSGNQFSPHYKDQTDRYNKGEFYQLLINSEVIKQQKNKLIFTKK